MTELGPEKRVLLAIVLSALIVLLWTRYMQKKYPPQAPASAPTLPAPVATTEASEAPAATLAKPQPRPPLAAKMGTEEREIVVETDVARIVFSTRGAVVKSWTFRHYKDKPVRGKPLDVVHSAASATLGYPLGFALADREREKALNQALFVASPAAAELRAPAELTFEYSDGKVAAVKRVRFDAGYVVELETHLHVAGVPVEHGVAWRGGFGDSSLETAWADLKLLWRESARLERKPAEKIPEQEGFSAAGLYGGLEDRYFAALFLARSTPAADAPPPLRLTARRLSWQPTGAKKPQPAAELAVAWPTGSAVRLFVGPKALDVLGETQPAGSPRALDELVDFGWFGLIARPLFLALRWLHRAIPNYGWSIVLLTLLINMALFPLKWKSMQSAWKMQKIAPQMRAIQDKYKKYRFNDPRKQPMQQELMALYREHGVNPLGGCLPLLLQIPFFIAFYNVLVVAIELRHAPWFGWIRDLSARDPYFILPILMTATMFISTKMTPMTTTDPIQQKMMTVMPLMFALPLAWLSSGLVLYWMVSNVAGVGQQYWINRHQRGREELEKRAKRKKKP